MTTCYTYDSASKQLIPHRVIHLDRRVVVHPTVAQCAAANPPAYPQADPIPPAPPPPEGKVAVADGYTLVDGAWVPAYRFEDAPPRRFSKLRIVAALMAADVWPQVKSFIEAQGLYDLYLAAQDFAEDNAYFVQGRAALQAELGWTDAQTEQVLQAATVE